MTFDFLGWFFQGWHHVFIQLVKPVLNYLTDFYLLMQRHFLFQMWSHRQYFVLLISKFDSMDPWEQFFEMKLDDGRVLGLPQDLEHIIISQKIEPWEFVSFLLQVVIQCFLASLQLSHYCWQSLKEPCNIRQLNNMMVERNSIHDVPVILVQSFPSTLLFR